MRTGNSYRTDSGPLYGREISISYLEHDADAAEDRLLLHVWEQPDTGWPAHTYDVYRNGPGWNTLWAALGGGPPQMAAAVAWWHDQQSKAPHAGYRILAAIDSYGQAHATPQQLERELELTAGTLEHDGLYARTLSALIAHGLVDAQPSGSLAVTAAASEILRPEDPETVQQFVQKLSTVDTTATGMESPPVLSTGDPNAFLNQPIRYTHWAVFDDGTAADQCAAAFNAVSGWTAAVEPSPRISDEWLLLASRTSPRAAFDAHHDQAQLIAQSHGALANAGETIGSTLAFGNNSAVAAFPSPPRPSTTDTVPVTDLNRAEAASPTPTPRRAR